MTNDGGVGSGMKVEIEVVIDRAWDKPRIVQKFPYGGVNTEHCVHGIKLRWSCDSCEDDLLIEEKDK